MEHLEGVELSSGERTQLVQDPPVRRVVVRVLLWTPPEMCGGPVRKNGEAGSPCSDVQWRQRVSSGLALPACAFSCRRALP